MRNSIKWGTGNNNAKQNQAQKLAGGKGTTALVFGPRK